MSQKGIFCISQDSSLRPIKDFLDYNGDSDDDTLVSQFFQPNSALTQCNYGYDVVDENDFRAELASAAGRFSFTVEEGTCSIAKVRFKLLYPIDLPRNSSSE